jgi:predicted membrane protein
MSTVTAAAGAVTATVKKTAISLHEVLVDLTKLENPTVAAAVAAFVLTLIPGTGITSTTLVAIVAGVGVVASVIDKFTSSNTPSA